MHRSAADSSSTVSHWCATQFAGCKWMDRCWPMEMAVVRMTNCWRCEIVGCCWWPVGRLIARSSMHHWSATAAIQMGAQFSWVLCLATVYVARDNCKTDISPISSVTFLLRKFNSKITMKIIQWKWQCWRHTSDNWTGIDRVCSTIVRRAMVVPSLVRDPDAYTIVMTWSRFF